MYRGTGQKVKKPVGKPTGFRIYPGDVLLFHAVASAVPSALEGLTTVFGMGTGVAPPASPPGILMMSKVKVGFGTNP